MEKNRTIIILLSIVLTVIVFVVVGLWLFVPRQAPAAPAGAAGSQYTQGTLAQTPAAGAASPSPSPSQDSASGIVNQNVLIVKGTEGAVAFQSGPDGKWVRKNLSASPEPSASPAASAEPSAVPEASPSPEPSASPEVQPSPSPSPKAKVLGNQATPSPKPAASPAAKPAAKESLPPKAAAASAKTGREYWIQVISSTSKDRVEQLRKELATLGFVGRVVAYSKDGTDFYRLRYGPYTKKAEAEKFLEWVRLIKGLSGSYITENAAGKANP